MSSRKPDDDTSLTLMLRLQKNPADEAAWDEFVQHYQPMIRAWCLKWGSQNCDADDVTQEVLVRLLKAMSKFQYDPARSFRPWLKAVTHNAWNDFVSSRRRRFGRDHGWPRCHRRFQRRAGRPGRADGRRVQPRAARPGDAADREARQADDLAGLPADRHGEPPRRRGRRRSWAWRSPWSSSPGTGCRRCSRRKCGSSRENRAEFARSQCPGPPPCAALASRSANSACSGVARPCSRTPISRIQVAVDKGPRDRARGRGRPPSERCHQARAAVPRTGRPGG